MVRDGLVEGLRWEEKEKKKFVRFRLLDKGRAEMGALLI